MDEGADKDIGEEVGSSNSAPQAQSDALIESTHEMSDMSSFHLPKDEDNNQDPCIEKLEIKDQEQKLAASASNNDRTEKAAAEILQKESSMGKTKTSQKLDSRASHGSSVILSKKAGASSQKPGAPPKTSSAEISSGATNFRASHPSRGSEDGNLGSLARLSGGTTSRKGESVEHKPSASGLISRQAHARKSHSNFTVPQPFALATDKRASLGGQPHSVGRVYGASRSFNSQMFREADRKNSEEKNGEDVKHHESNRVEDNKAHTFNFNSDVRAERRKEFNSKVEERLTAKEAEKNQAQAKTKEDIQQEIKKFRKSLTFKATPMPSFYQDATPPKLEIKKIPLTRAKSPKLGRRNSNVGAHTSHEAKEPSHSHSTKENNVQIKSSKPAAQAAESKKNLHTSKNALKQVAGLNALSEKAPPSVRIDKKESEEAGEEEERLSHLLDDFSSGDRNNGHASDFHDQVGGEVEVTNGGQSNAPGTHVQI